MASSQLPGIVLLQNKLQSDKPDLGSMTLGLIQDAEKEYEEMCRIVGQSAELKAIDEMIVALKSKQLRSAQNYALRVQDSINYYKKKLKTGSVSKSHSEAHGPADHSSRVDSVPAPDYNHGRRDQAPDYSLRRPDQAPDYNQSRRDQAPDYNDHRRGQAPDYNDRRREQAPDYNDHRRDQAPEENDHRNDENRMGSQRDARQSRREPDKNRFERDNDQQKQLERQLDQMARSEEASRRLRKDNPNLTDLNDADRPVKIAEKYSQLYDNENADALEELQDKCRLSERQAIACLLNILLETYERSHRKSREQIEDIDLEIRRLMTKFRINTDHGISETKDIIKGDISSLVQYRKSLARLSVPELQKTFEEGYLRKILHKFGCLDQRLPNVEKYTRDCVELTWLMCVQDQPIVLDTMDHRRHFNTEMYRAFTKQGKAVDFYVWPALLLHEGGGPLLAKGIAQGKPQ